MKLDIIMISYNREEAIARTLSRLCEASEGISEIIVVDNGSTDGTLAVIERFAAEMPHLRLIRSGTNLGVAGGRNLGIRHSTADILVFLDDDAEFESPDFPGRISDRFRSEPGLGATAFRIVNGHTKAMRPNEFPHRDKRKMATDREMDVAYFVGAGHAIRREALGSGPPYPEIFFYSQEELFLSYKIIKAGFRIVYLPDVKVFHWQAQTGRVVNARKWVLLLRNTLLVNYVFQPWVFFSVSLPIWAAKVLVRSGNAKAVFDGLAEFGRILGRRELLRDAVSFRTLFEIWRRGGRVLW